MADRPRLTPEEVADLLAPGPLVTCAPWVRPISLYGRRIETSETSDAREPD